MRDPNETSSSNTTAASSSVRPYTSYNFFFQLEREYILQILHGYRPTIDPSDVFDPSADNYHGPPLPSRYQDLILPYDWHIPGKAQRRKRSHRRTHGKIGFHELNDRISKAWSAADEETRSFCTNLSEVESKKYKKIKMAEAKMKKTTKKSGGKRKAADVEDSLDLSDPFIWALESPGDLLGMSRVVSGDSDLSRAAGLRDSLISESSNLTELTEVDIEDDEIVAMWKSISIADEEGSLPPGAQVCVEIGGTPPPAVSTSPPISSSLSPSAFQDEREDEGRKSFIDSEYEMYKELGKKFSRSTRTGLPPHLERKVYAATIA